MIEDIIFVGLLVIGLSSIIGFWLYVALQRSPKRKCWNCKKVVYLHYVGHAYNCIYDGRCTYCGRANPTHEEDLIICGDDK